MAALIGSSAPSLGRAGTTTKTLSLVGLVVLISTCLRGAYSTNLINNPPIVSPLEATSSSSPSTSATAPLSSTTADGINQLEPTSAATGFVAEWTYVGPWDSDLDDLVDKQIDIRSSHFSDEEGDQNTSFPPAAEPPFQSTSTNQPPHPASRSTPGTWQAGQDSWFLFGGVPPPNQPNSTAPATSDLWAFDDGTNTWRQIYSPTSNATGVQSSHPENIQLPHLCGSLKNGLLAVFGLQNEELQENNNDDNTVWLYDTTSKKNNAVWTSYICCDACLPDDTKNNSLDFCPKFQKAPVVWCASDSLLALQAPQQLLKSTARPIPSKCMKKRLQKNILWKFDLRTTQWEKLALVSDPAVSIQDCRPFETGQTNSQSLLYLVCRSPKSLEAKISVLDPTTGKMHTIPQGISLNKAFTRPKLWLPQYSVLNSLEIPESNLTLLFAGYHKLVDLWIHNRTSNRLFAVENIWKGSSLHVFQRTSTFYHLSVAVGQDNEDEGKNYTVFMVNPRSKFQQFYPGIINSTEHPRVVTSGRFHISILSDQGFFLPSRDVSYLLKASQDEEILKSSLAPLSVSTADPHQSQQASAVTSVQTSTGFPLEQKIDGGQEDPSFTTPSSHETWTTGHDPQAKDFQANPSTISPAPNPRKQIPGKSKNLAKISSTPATLSSSKDEAGKLQAPVSWTKSKKASASEVPASAFPDKPTSAPSGHRVDQSRIKTYPRMYPSLTTTTKSPQVHQPAAPAEPVEEADEIVFQSTEELAMADAQFASLANKQQQPEDDFGIRENRVPFHQFSHQQAAAAVATSAELVARDAKAVIGHGHHQQHNQNHHVSSPINNESSYSSMLFFAFSLSIFASIGIVVFVRRCVKCPPNRESALIVVKEPPPIRYNVFPDELSFHHPHTPIY